MASKHGRPQPLEHVAHEGILVAQLQLGRALMELMHVARPEVGSKVDVPEVRLRVGSGAESHQ